MNTAQELLSMVKSEKNLYTNNDERWLAVCARDAEADGSFFYAVQTTGVFCRPGCPSRLPLRSNIEFFTTAEDAVAAGYRPCKRCRPRAGSKNERIEKKIIHACTAIEQSQGTIKLEELAAQVDLSPCHFHRIFKKMVGVTPKQYANRLRSTDFANRLQTASSVTEAIYEAGYSSSSRAYDSSLDQLAMTPSSFRKGGRGERIIYGIAESRFGMIGVAFTNRGICSIAFGESHDQLLAQLRQTFPLADIREAEKEVNALVSEVVAFINEPRQKCSLPLDIQGTAFQQRVWEILRQIRPGETMSYTDVAKQLGRPRAFRAVASAIASNTIAVLIPCHRVLTKDGKITGYRWGAARKSALLANEKKHSRN